MLQAACIKTPVYKNAIVKFDATRWGFYFRSFFFCSLRKRHAKVEIN